MHRRVQGTPDPLRARHPRAGDYHHGRRDLACEALARGVERLYVNLMYVLSDEDGELHPPKDPMRNEIALSPTEVSEIRAQVATDAARMGEMGLELSPGWWRQLGNEEAAMMAEALLVNVAGHLLPDEGKRRQAADSYEIHSIVEERGRWALVRWAGYHPSWEAWRISGAAGSPVETWEEVRKLKRTTAWLERHS